MHAGVSGRNQVGLWDERISRVNFSDKWFCSFGLWATFITFNTSAFSCVHVNIHAPPSTSDVRGVLEAQAERAAVQVGRTQEGDACTAWNKFLLTRVIDIVLAGDAGLLFTMHTSFRRKMQLTSCTRR